MRICSVDGCTTKHKAKGFCMRHYNLAHYDSIEATKRAAEWAKRNPERKSASLAAWKTENAARVKEYNKQHYSADIEKSRKRARDYYRNNPEKAKASHDAWVSKNREHFYLLQSRRRARQAGAEGNHSVPEVKELYKKQRGKCAACAESLPKNFHRDHIQPLSKGGSHWISNIQLLCPTCNCQKKDKDPIQFMQERERLL